MSSYPVKELKGFKRIALQPGETKKVTFTVHASQMAFYNRAMDYVVEPGKIEVYVGRSSEDIKLTGQFAITGTSTGEASTVSEKVFFSEVEVS